MRTWRLLPQKRRHDVHHSLSVPRAGLRRQRSSWIWEVEMTIQQLDFFVPAARLDDPFTSKLAASHAQRRMGGQKALLLGAFAKTENLTSEEAAQLAGVNMRSAWWKRVSELHQAGLIVFTGSTRVSSLGEHQRVYAITEAGRALAEKEVTDVCKE